MAQQICIYDRVTLHNGLQGSVQFIGGIPNGMFYGITLDENKGTNNGTFNKIKYFACDDKHGTFVTQNKIINSQPTQLNQLLPRVCIGDNVYVTNKQRTGVVRFVGIVHFQPGSGCWYGVDLEEPIGLNNGCIDGRKYFHSAPHHGIFCKAEQIHSVCYLLCVPFE